MYENFNEFETHCNQSNILEPGSKLFCSTTHCHISLPTQYLSQKDDLIPDGTDLELHSKKY